jgi:hypothetical protein
MRLQQLRQILLEDDEMTAARVAVEYPLGPFAVNAERAVLATDYTYGQVWGTLDIICRSVFESRFAVHFVFLVCF